MTREQRIEAAARLAYCQWTPLRFTGWDEQSESAKKKWAEDTREVLAAAFPELMSDPPTGWVAPWNATETIRDTIWGAVIPLPEDSQEAAEIDVWADARDAYTKEQT